MDRSDRHRSGNKSIADRFRRWYRRRQRDRAIRAEESKITKQLASKARARELRELEKSSPETDPQVRQPAPQPQHVEPAADVSQQIRKQVAEPVPFTGVIDHWKKYRKVRAAIAEQSQVTRHARRLAAAKSGSKSKSSKFGVGSTEQSASDVRVPYRQRPIYFIRKYARQSVKRRIPHWFAAMSPALVFGLGVIMPAMTESNGHAASAIVQYREAWTAAVQKGDRPKEAELCGRRVIFSPQSESRDLIAYFDTLVANGELQRAVQVLLAREDDQREQALAEYRFDIAERFIGRLQGSAELVNLALKKFGESLQGPLAKHKEIKARKVLSSAMAVRGDLIGALGMLAPIRNVDLVSRIDSLWLSRSINPANANDAFFREVETAAKEIEARVAGTQALDFQDIAAYARVASLLARDDQFIAWLDSDTRLDAPAKVRWRREIANLSLVRELRTVPLNPEAAWAKLRPILDQEPDNEGMIDTAIGLAIAPPDRTSKSAREWVSKKLKSDSVDAKTLGRASMAAHANAQWPLAIELYEGVAKREPKNPIVLNNLAGMYYKIPPYRLDEALKLIDRAIAELPDNLGILETKGQILARMGRVDEARDILERCLTGFPNEWNLHNTLAQIYEYQGNPQLGALHREKLAKISKPANAPIQERIDFRASAAKPAFGSESRSK
jgi:tetratricopeptide (TPR) repeat protein